MKSITRSLKALTLLLLAALFTSALAGCASSKSTAATSESKSAASAAPSSSPASSKITKLDKPVTIRLGRVGTGESAGALDAAIKLGKFKEAGINLVVSDFSNGADGIAALIGGSLDLFNGSYEHVLRQIENGLDVKAFALLNNRQGYKVIVRADSPYKNLKDLKGATLGVTKVGSLSDTTLRKILREVDVNPDKDVQIVNTGTGATVVAALESKNVAAAMISGVTVTELVKGGKYRILYDPDFETAGLVLIGSSKWAKTNSDALKVYLSVYQAQLKDIKTNPEKYVDVFKDTFPKLDSATLLEEIKAENSYLPEDLIVTKAAADDVVKTQLQLGTIKKEIPLEQATDKTYLQ